MLLVDLLKKYQGSSVVVCDGSHEWDIESALNLSYPDGIDGLDLDQQITYVHDEDRILVWILPAFNAEPAYVLKNVPKRPGRPGKDKVNVGFTVDREVAEKLATLPRGEVSTIANRLLRRHLGLPDRNVLKDRAAGPAGRQTTELPDPSGSETMSRKREQR